MTEIVNDLFKSAGDGSVSLSKTMKAIGFLACTWVIVMQAYHGQLSVEMFLTYFGIVVGNDQIGKWQSIRREVMTGDKTNPETAPTETKS